MIRESASWFRGRARRGASVAPFAAEANVLINPAHPDFSQLVIGDPLPFAFDRSSKSKSCAVRGNLTYKIER